MINTKGVTRIVIVLKDVVIKIPNFRYSWQNFIRGILSNINEHQTYNYTLIGFPERAKLLCPVVWMSWGGWVLVMKRASTIQCNVVSLGSLVNEHIKYFAGDDTHSNYGYYKGKLVKIDYGELDQGPTYYKNQIYNKYQ